MRVIIAFVVGATNVLLSILASLGQVLHYSVAWLVRIGRSAWSYHKCRGFHGVSTTGRKQIPTVKDIPGPWPVPVLGTRWLYLPVVGCYKLSQAHKAYHDMFECYGDIFKQEDLFNFPIINLRSPQDIEKMVKYNPKYPMRPPDGFTGTYRVTRPDRYNSIGMANVQGEEWHKLRKLSTPELSSSQVMQNFLPELNKVVDDLLYVIAELRDPVTKVLPDIVHVGQQLGQESSCLLMLGQRMGFLEREINLKALRLQEAVHEHFNACRDSFYGLPLWKLFATSTYRKLVKSEEAMYELISEMLDPMILQSEDTCPMDVTQCVLMSVLHRQELDIRDRKSSIIDFIAAGIHTMGNSLGIILHFLAVNPKTQQRLYEEVSSIAGINDPLTTKHLQSATYLKACIQESFRLVSTAPMVARITSEDMMFSGYHIPAGSVILCHLYEACNNERNFIRAKEFLPERWIPNEAKELGLTPMYPFLVSPFGFNKRICPGKKFSELQLSLSVAKIIRRFEMSSSIPLTLEFSFLLCLSRDMSIVFSDR